MTVGGENRQISWFEISCLTAKSLLIFITTTTRTTHPKAIKTSAPPRRCGGNFVADPIVACTLKLPWKTSGWLFCFHVRNQYIRKLLYILLFYNVALFVWNLAVKQTCLQEHNALWVMRIATRGCSFDKQRQVNNNWEFNQTIIHIRIKG